MPTYSLRPDAIPFVPSTATCQRTPTPPPNVKCKKQGKVQDSSTNSTSFTMITTPATTRCDKNDEQTKILVFANKLNNRKNNNHQRQRKRCAHRKMSQSLHQSQESYPCSNDNNVKHSTHHKEMQQQQRTPFRPSACPTNNKEGGKDTTYSSRKMYNKKWESVNHYCRPNVLRNTNDVDTHQHDRNNEDVHTIHRTGHDTIMMPVCHEPKTIETIGSFNDDGHNQSESIGSQNSGAADATIDRFLFCLSTSVPSLVPTEQKVQPSEDETTTNTITYAWLNAVMQHNDTKTNHNDMAIDSSRSMSKTTSITKKMSDSIQSDSFTLTKLMPSKSSRLVSNRKSINSTTLRAQETTKESVPQNEGSSKDDCGQLIMKTSTTKEKPSNYLYSSKVIDMTRLRNRWWDLLQKHYENNNKNRSQEERGVDGGDMNAGNIGNKEMKQTKTIVEEQLPVESVSATNNIQRSNTTTITTRICDATGNANGRTRDGEVVARSTTFSLNISASRSSTDTIAINTSTVRNAIIQAIKRNDRSVLQSLLDELACDAEDSLLREIILCPTTLTTTSTKNDNNTDTPSEVVVASPFKLVVIWNRPQLLKLFFSVFLENNKNNNMKMNDDTLYQNQIREMVFVAAEYGYDECMEQLLLSIGSYRTSSATTLNSFSSMFSLADIITTKDNDGNTVLHYCSRNHAPLSTFQLLFDYIARSCSSGSSSSSSSSLSYAAKCISIKNHIFEQTVLHVACSHRRVDIVDYVIMKIGKYHSAALSKLLAMQDKHCQTPLLAAIAADCTDIVMSLLMWRGNNSLHRRYRYSIGPTKSSTKNGCNSHHSSASNAGTFSEPTTARSSGIASTGSNTTNGTSPPCPLVWAVTKSQDPDMVSLLLEFNNPTSDSGYNLDDALRAGVDVRLQLYSSDDKYSYNEDKDDDNYGKRIQSLTIVRVLIEAGANPCSAPDTNETTLLSLSTNANVTSTKIKRNESPIISAIRDGDCECLILLLDTYRCCLNCTQNNRRRDPKLQKQPESFFINLESRENNELLLILRESLLTSLYYSWQSLSATCKQGQSSEQDHETNSIRFLSCSIALYRRNVHLTLTDIERLKSSMALSTRFIVASSPPTVSTINNTLDASPTTNPEYVASYVRRIPSPTSTESDREPMYALQNSSLLMLQMEWCPLSCNNNKSKTKSSIIGCTWIEEQCLTTNSGYETPKPVNTNKLLCIEPFGKPDVVLICPEGTRFEAHSLILSQYSQKLAAAIRFATISVPRHQLLNGHNNIEVLVDVPSKQLRWMLEHMYHGSIVVGRFSKNRSITETFYELLELLLIADEFICPSLIQECEMRLLATDYCKCFCWYCNNPTLLTPQQACFRQQQDTTATTNHKTSPVVLLESAVHFQTVQCKYKILGTSVLVTPDVALDVLAVINQLGTHWESEDYSITFHSNKTTSVVGSCGKNDSNLLDTPTRRKLLDSIREVALCSLFQNLNQVIGKASFQSTLEQLLLPSGGTSITDNSSKKNNTSIKNEGGEGLVILLHILLQELYGSVSMSTMG